MTSSSASTLNASRRLLWWLVVVVAAAVIVYLVVVIATRESSSSSGSALTRPPGLPAAVSAALADQMSLAPVTPSMAKDFTLTDQTGATVSLGAYRGKVVVLQFMDPHCVDVCPIASREVVDAYRDLSSKRADVVFVTVNVNKYNTAVSDMAAFTNHEGLNAVPTWHFSTGTPAALEAIWHDYGVEVTASSPTADVKHSSQVYFIDPGGHVRFLATSPPRHLATSPLRPPTSNPTAPPTSRRRSCQRGGAGSRRWPRRSPPELGSPVRGEVPRWA